MRIVLRTQHDVYVSPTVCDVEMAVARVFVDPQEHAVLDRGDSSLRVCQGRLEWGSGEVLKRVNLESIGTADSVARETFLRLLEGDVDWARGLPWTAVDVHREIGRERRTLFVDLPIGIGMAVILAWIARPDQALETKSVLSEVGRAIWERRVAITLVAVLSALLLAVTEGGNPGDDTASSPEGRPGAIWSLLGVVGFAAILSFVGGAVVGVGCHDMGTGSLGPRCRFSLGLLMPLGGFAALVYNRDPARRIWTLFQGVGVGLVSGAVHAIMA